MKKRIISVLLTALIIVNVFSGCSKEKTNNLDETVKVETDNELATEDKESSEKPETSGKTVKIAWLNMTDEDTMDPVTGIISPGKGTLEKMLSEKTGHKVEIISVAASGWIQQVETLVKSGECDVTAYSNQTQVPSWLEDLTTYIAADEELGNGGLENTFINYAQHLMHYSAFDYPDAYGKIFGLPYFMNQSFIAYDSLLFEQWGVEPLQEGVTYEEMLEIAKKMTGTNPVTGKENYGIYLRSNRSEFNAIAFDALPSVSLDSGDINDFDTEKYVEPMKDSEEMLNYFKWLSEAASISPEGITTNAGNELWLSPENNIAINVTPLDALNLMNIYYRIKDEDTTSRFQYLNMPTSSDGMQGFPVIQNVGISKFSEVKDESWDVIKAITTDTEIVDFMFLNYFYGFLPVLKDTSELTFMSDNPTASDRYEFQSEHGFITDDYWFYRTPVQPVISEVLAGTITPEEARQKTYEEVVKWVENKKTLSN